MGTGKDVDQKDLSGWIAKAAKAEKIREFQYPYVEGFYVTIAFGSRFILNQIRQMSAEPYTDRRTRTREERLNDEKLSQGYAQRIVKDWRGLTVAKLDRLVPGTFEEAVAAYQAKKDENPDFKIPDDETIKNTEVVYSVETAQMILSSSSDFMLWVVEMCGDSGLFSTLGEEKKDQYENLE